MTPAAQPQPQPSPDAPADEAEAHPRPHPGCPLCDPAIVASKRARYRLPTHAPGTRNRVQLVRVNGGDALLVVARRGA